MSISIFHNLFHLFLLVLPPRSKKRPSPTVTKKGQKSPKNWEVTVGDTHMYTLRTREKSKNFSLYRRYGNDRHRLSLTKSRQCRKWNAKKFSLFGKGFANDLHRPTFDLHQKRQKSPKNWENVGRCTSYPYFTHARKKVKNFFYIERYVNDLHRPTSFFHGVEERRFYR